MDTDYRRYDTKRELKILQELNRLVLLKHNLFIPTMKLTVKYRTGRKVHKRYTIDTPFNRVINSKQVSDERKRRVIELSNSTDLLKLIARIKKLEATLDRAYRSKYCFKRD